MKPKIVRDLPPKSPSKVRGGAAGQEGTKTPGSEGTKNDNITLVRG